MPSSEIKLTNVVWTYASEMVAQGCAEQGPLLSFVFRARYPACHGVERNHSNAKWEAIPVAASPHVSLKRPHVWTICCTSTATFNRSEYESAHVLSAIHAELFLRRRGQFIPPLLDQISQKSGRRRSHLERNEGGVMLLVNDRNGVTKPSMGTLCSLLQPGKKNAIHCYGAADARMESTPAPPG